VQTLLLLPGLLCDATVWRAQVHDLSDVAEISVIDYGDADRLEKMAAIVLASAPPRFSIAGHSMGARVALEVYAAAPERVERLAHLDTGVHPVAEGEEAARMRLVRVARERGMDALCDAWLLPMVHPDRRGDTAFMQPLRDMVTSFTPQRYEKQIAALLNRPASARVPPMIKCPVLIGVGSHDEWASPAQHEPIAAAIPGAKVTIFEGAGHMAPYEKPDAVTKAMRDWMAIPPA
jgi:pimeloyl-ACP methyl ester carboxylesterase